jgi:enoyl-CoA hydratase/carnithine racemase
MTAIGVLTMTWSELRHCDRPPQPRAIALLLDACDPPDYGVDPATERVLAATLADTASVVVAAIGAVVLPAWAALLACRADVVVAVPEAVVDLTGDGDAVSRFVALADARTPPWVDTGSWSGRRIEAAELLRSGLVAELTADARALGGQVAERLARNSRLALDSILAITKSALGLDLSDVLAAEADAQVACMSSPEHAAAMAARSQKARQ